nr:MAG TPA: hypothetical protein [Caudoviricetes sp.]
MGRRLPLSDGVGRDGLETMPETVGKTVINRYKVLHWSRQGR